MRLFLEDDRLIGVIFCSKKHSGENLMIVMPANMIGAHSRGFDSNISGILSFKISKVYSPATRVPSTCMASRSLKVVRFW